jgi:glycosyltransferase involved in cell wall biosynthesis
MIGPGGPEFVKILERKYPAATGRVFATGILKLDAIPGHLAACDLLIQVYPDGISGRRGTAMAGLSCGVPILTNIGVATETIWETSGAVCLVNSIPEVANRVSVLLDDQVELDRLRECATRLYRERFHVDRMVAAFRCHPASSAHENAGLFSALGKPL